MGNNSHVLYLFGAGASANAIPVADKLPDDMGDVACELEKWYKKAPPQLQEVVEGRKEEVCKALLRELANTINVEKRKSRKEKVNLSP